MAEKALQSQSSINQIELETNDLDQVNNSLAMISSEEHQSNN